MKKTIFSSLGSIAVVAACAAPAHATELLTNGNFEAGAFTGWTVTNQTGSSGTWNIDVPGTTTPVSGTATSPNANGGGFYAVTDQGGRGAHILTQSFTVGAGTTSTELSYQFFAHNRGSLTTRNDIDYAAGTAGFYRVDILSATSGAFSTAAADVVKNLLLATGSASLLPYQTANYDLGLAAGTYQLRFAEVDNSGFFNLGLDNVSISSTNAGAVPEPASWAMMILGMGAVGFAMRRRQNVRTTVSYA